MDMTADERDREPQNAPPSTTEISSARTPLDEFIARVLTDVSLHDKLLRPNDIDQFITLALDTAANCGFHLSAEAVRARMLPRLPGLDGLLNAAVHETPLPPEGWLPIQTSWQGDQLYVHWSYFGAVRLTSPFFEGSIQRSQSKPFNRLFRYSTPISRLPEWLRAHPGLQPSGLIFHMSRCGSTLVSQMLAALDGNVVVSEASPVDTVVWANHVRSGLSDDDHARWLNWIVCALGQPRGGGERHYFIKLDCWHTLALPLFRRVFPTVPWVFLYRDPVEVLVSQLRMPGVQMTPGVVGPDIFEMEPFYGSQDRDGYFARVLAKICAPIAQEYSKTTGLLVNYRQLPEALWETIIPHFGVACSERDRVAMQDIARYDAKIPGLQFAPDVATKQQEAGATMRSVADAQLGDIYRRLEELRLGA